MKISSQVNRQWPRSKKSLIRAVSTQFTDWPGLAACKKPYPLKRVIKLDLSTTHVNVLRIGHIKLICITGQPWITSGNTPPIQVQLTTTSKEIGAIQACCTGDNPSDILFPQIKDNQFLSLRTAICSVWEYSGFLPG